MSLLMDALRKAEQQKHMLGERSSTDAAAPATALELEPIAGQQPASQEAGIPQMEAPLKKPKVSDEGTRLPELPAHLEDLDEQFLSHTPSPALKSAPPPEPSAPVTHMSVVADKPSALPGKTPEVARNLFEAKQPVAHSNRNFAIAVGTLSLVAAVGIGGYFWWQLQPRSNNLVAMVPTTAPVQPPATLPKPAAPPAQIATPVAVAPALTIAAPDQHAAQRGYAREEEDEEETPPKRAAPKVLPVEPAKPESPIRITKAPLKVDPSLDLAHQAFNRGDHELALKSWQKVRAADPYNADALHGLAALALLGKRPDEAAEYYLRALEANPKDGLALSGLASLRGQANLLQTESRLKNLLAEQPDSAHLNFAMGNLYAHDARWAEAQQAYFKAHVADAANPDYLFNLAISLDQLRQPQLAVQYYTRALAAAEQHQVGFDRAQASERLNILRAGLLH